MPLQSSNSRSQKDGYQRQLYEYPIPFLADQFSPFKTALYKAMTSLLIYLTVGTYIIIRETDMAMSRYSFGMHA